METQQAAAFPNVRGLQWVTRKPLCLHPKSTGVLRSEDDLGPRRDQGSPTGIGCVPTSSRRATRPHTSTRRGETHLPSQHLVQQDPVGPPVHGLPVRLIGDYLWGGRQRLRLVTQQGRRARGRLHCSPHEVAMTPVAGCEGILQIGPAENFCPMRAPDSPGLLFRTHLETDCVAGFC